MTRLLLHLDEDGWHLLRRQPHRHIAQAHYSDAESAIADCQRLLADAGVEAIDFFSWQTLTQITRQNSPALSRRDMPLWLEQQSRQLAGPSDFRRHIAHPKTRFKPAEHWLIYTLEASQSAPVASICGLENPRLHVVSPALLIPALVAKRSKPQALVTLIGSRQLHQFLLSDGHTVFCRHLPLPELSAEASQAFISHQNEQLTAYLVTQGLSDRTQAPETIHLGHAEELTEKVFACLRDERAFRLFHPGREGELRRQRGQQCFQGSAGVLSSLALLAGAHAWQNLPPPLPAHTPPVSQLDPETHWPADLNASSAHQLVATHTQAQQQAGRMAQDWNTLASALAGCIEADSVAWSQAMHSTKISVTTVDDESHNPACERGLRSTFGASADIRITRANAANADLRSSDVAARPGVQYEIAIRKQP